MVCIYMVRQRTFERKLGGYLLLNFLVAVQGRPSLGLLIIDPVT